MPPFLAGVLGRVRLMTQGNTLSLSAVIIYLVFAIALFRYSLPAKSFSEELLIYDAIWLDAWSLGFFFVNVFIWLSRLGWRTKALLGVAVLGIYGFVEIGLILDGTPFSSNAYWGDQKFRQAMILKLMTFSWPTDFYYNKLPPFYPPLLYMLFSWLGKSASLPAYQMMKAGGMVAYLIGPTIAFRLWRLLVGPLKAWLIVLFTFLICSTSVPYLLSAPHAFAATVVFIPWWLYFVEGVNQSRRSRWHVLSGGLIGAAILTTYFYPFFLGAIVLLVRLIFRGCCAGNQGGSRFRWSGVAGVFSAVILFSSWYWLPLLLSILEHGFDRSRGGWHHIDSTSIQLAYMAFSYTGVLFLGGIWYALRRINVRLFRSLAVLLGGVIPLLLIGSVLGAFDHPINLAKARDTVIVFAGPFIGLAAAAWLRRRSGRTTRWVVPVLLSLTLIVFGDQFSRFMKSKWVRTARTAYVPTWNTDRDEMKERAGSVFLCGHEEFPSFYPVFSFVAANEHYSHPASRFKKRYDLLDLVEPFRDPRLLNLVLRTNRYDRVDYFMPRRGDSTYDLTVSLSNFPNRYSTRVFQFSLDSVGDSLLFEPQTGDNLFRVIEPVGANGDRFDPLAAPEPDSLVTRMRLAMIRDHLTTEGRAELDGYLGADWANWRQLVAEDDAVTFGDSLRVKDVRIVSCDDSLHFLFAFDAVRTVSRRFKVSLHLSADQFYNFDFFPAEPTNAWLKWRTVICRRSIAKIGPEFRLFVGFYDRLGALPGVLKLDCDLTETN